VLTCGLNATPSASIRDCMRSMLACMRATSTRAVGVWRSWKSAMGRGYDLMARVGTARVLAQSRSSSQGPYEPRALLCARSRRRVQTSPGLAGKPLHALAVCAHVVAGDAGPPRAFHLGDLAVGAGDRLRFDVGF